MEREGVEFEGKADGTKCKDTRPGTACNPIDIGRGTTLFVEAVAPVTVTGSPSDIVWRWSRVLSVGAERR